MISVTCGFSLSALLSQISNMKLCKTPTLPGFAQNFFQFFVLLLRRTVKLVVTAAGVVPGGSPKKRSRTSSKVQFIFYFWSFEISRNILRNQKILYV